MFQNINKCINFKDIIACVYGLEILKADHFCLIKNALNTINFIVILKFLSETTGAFFVIRRLIKLCNVKLVKVAEF